MVTFCSLATGLLGRTALGAKKVLPWWLLGAPCHRFSALEFAWTLSTLSDFCDWKLSGKANMLEG